MICFFFSVSTFSSSVTPTGTGLTTSLASGVTTVTGSKSTTTHPGACVKVEAMNPQIGVIDDIYIYPSSLNGNASELVAGRKGVNFPETVLRPNITVVFNRVGNLFFIQVPPQSQSNVQQIYVEFFNPQGQLINSYTSPANSPQLPNNYEVDNVIKVVIHLISTSDGTSPKNVTLDIIGCFFEGN